MVKTPVEDRVSLAAHACTVIGLGLFYMLCPSDWYGPSWSYFHSHGVPVIAAGGFGLGTCLTGIGILQLICLWRNTSRLLPTLFFLSGFTLSTAGLILGAEGIAGHHGLQEAPLFVVFGGIKFITMSNIIVDRRRNST